MSWVPGDYNKIYPARPIAQMFRHGRTLSGHPRRRVMLGCFRGRWTWMPATSAGMTIGAWSHRRGPNLILRQAQHEVYDGIGQNYFTAPNRQSAGICPASYTSEASWPDLIRPSTCLGHVQMTLEAVDLDARIKSGHDDSWCPRFPRTHILRRRGAPSRRMLG